MINYDDIQNNANQALNATTPVKVLSSNSIRAGYRLTNFSGILIYVVAVHPGDVPTLTTMKTNKVSQQIPSNSWIEDGGRSVDVYALADSGTPNLFVEELMNS